MALGEGIERKGTPLPVFQKFPGVSRKNFLRFPAMLTVASRFLYSKLLI